MAQNPRMSAVQQFKKRSQRPEDQLQGTANIEQARAGATGLAYAGTFAEPEQPPEGRISARELLAQQQAQTPSASQNRSIVGDFADSVVTGTAMLPGAVAGLADIPLGLAGFDRPVSRATGAIGEFTGFSPSAFVANRRENSQLTQGTQDAQRAVDEAFEGAGGGLAGVGAGALAMLRNPRAIVPLVGETLPATLIPAGAAGLATRGLSAGARRAGAFAAEGATAAGFAMDNIDESVDPQRAALAAAGSGVAVGAIGAAGAAFSRRLGLIDPDYVFVDGRAALAEGVARQKLLPRVLGGAVTEAVMQEMPQATVETILQNWAEGNPLTENLDRAVVEGVFAGGAMGGAFNVAGAREFEPTNINPDAPTNTGQSQGEGMQGRTVAQLQKSFAAMSTLAENPDGDPEITKRAISAMTDIRSEMIRKGMDPRLANERLSEQVYLENAERLREMRLKFQETLQTNPQKAQSIRNNIARMEQRQQQVLAAYPQVEEKAAQAELSSLLDTNRKLVKRLKKAQDSRNGSEQQVLRQAVAANRDRLETLVSTYAGLEIPQADRKNAGTAGKNAGKGAKVAASGPAAQPQDNRPVLERESAAIEQVNARMASGEISIELAEKIFRKDGALKGGEKGRSDRPSGFFRAILEMPISKLLRKRAALQADSNTPAAAWQVELVDAVLGADRQGDLAAFQTIGQPLTIDETFRLMQSSPMTDTQRQRITRVAELSSEDSEGNQGAFARLADEENVTAKSVRDSHKAAVDALAEEVQLAKGLDTIEEAQAMIDGLLGRPQQDVSPVAAVPEPVPQADLQEAPVAEAPVAEAPVAEAPAEMASPEAPTERPTLGLSADRRRQRERQQEIEATRVQTAVQGDAAVQADLTEQLTGDAERGIAPTMGVRETPNSKQDGTREESINLETLTREAGFLPSRRVAMDRLWQLTSNDSPLTAAEKAAGKSEIVGLRKTIKDNLKADQQLLRDMQARALEIADVEVDARAIAKELESMRRDQKDLARYQADARKMAAMREIWSEAVANAPVFAAKYPDLAEELALAMPDVTWDMVQNDARVLKGLTEQMNWMLRELNNSNLEQFSAEQRELFQLELAIGAVNNVVNTISTANAAGERIYAQPQRRIKAAEDFYQATAARAAALREELAGDLREVEAGFADYSARAGTSPEARNRVARAEQLASDAIAGREIGDIAGIDSNALDAAQTAQADKLISEADSQAAAALVDDPQAIPDSPAVQYGANMKVKLQKNSAGNYSYRGYDIVKEGKQWLIRETGTEQFLEARDTRKSAIDLIDAVTANEQPAPNSDETKLSVQLRVENSAAHTGASLRAAFQRVFQTNSLPSNIQVVETAQELSLLLSERGLTQRLAASAQGLVTDDGTVYLIAENIDEGQELPVFLHEIGVHVGLERFGDPRMLGKLLDVISNEPSTTELGQAVARARLRVTFAAEVLAREGQTMSREARDSELLAYTVEEGTRALLGTVAESEMTQSPLRQFLDQVRAWVQQGLSAVLGRRARTPQLTMEDVLALAMGAAENAVQQGFEAQGATQFPRQIRTHEGPGQFSLSAERMTAQMGREMPEYMQPAWSAFNKGVRQLGRKFMFTHTLVQTAEKLLPGVAGWDRTVRRRTSERTALDQKTQLIVDKLQGEPELTNKINTFAMEAQRSKGWGFDPAQWGFEIESQSVDPGLAAKFNALPAEAQTIVAGMMRHAFYLRQEMNRQMSVNVQLEYDGLIERAREAGNEERAVQLEDDLNQQLDKLEQRASAILPSYLPLRRYGNYAVIRKSAELQEAIAQGDQELIAELKQDETHYDVRFYETAFSGEKAANALRQQTDGTGTVEFFERQRMDVSGEFIPFNMVEGMRARLEASETSPDGMGGETQDATVSGMLNALSKLYITALSEDSARKSELERTNIAGADPNMVRAFVTHASSMSATIAALKINRETNQLIQSMKEDARQPDQPPGVRDRKMETFNEVMYRHSAAIDPKPSPFTDSAMGATSIFMLLTSPAYYMQNATQPFMLSAPFMGGRHGFFNATSALIRNYKSVSKTWQPGLSGDLADISPKTVPDPDKRALLQELQLLGLMDVGMAADLGSFKNPRGVLGMKALASTHQKMIHAVRTVELFNRGVSALAAYELEMGSKLNTGTLQQRKDRAKAYAIEVVKDTQGDYSGQNAPSIINRMPAGRLITQFRKFQLIQLTVLARTLHGSFAGADPVEKAIARKQLLYILGMHASVGGLMGLPAANIIGWAIANAFGDEDEPADIELRVARAIGDRDTSDLIMRGIPTLFGMDVSSRLGMGMATSILPYTELEMSRDGAAAIVAGLMGPSVAAGQQVWEGVGMVGDGQVTMGVSQMLPRGLRDALRAYHYKTEGVTRRNMAQDVAISPEDISLMDALLQGMGWPTATLTDRQKINRWLYATEETFNSRSSEIRGQFALAENNEDRARLRREFLQLQATKVKYGYKRQPLSTLMDEVRSKRKREQDMIEGVMTDSSNRRFVQSLQR